MISEMHSTPTAILLINMGGPDDASQIRPYLRAIFRDPAILPLPHLLRAPLAGWISARRADKVAARYAQIGGGSPLRRWTGAQTRNLADVMNYSSLRFYPAFRYTAPLIPDVLRAAREDGCRDAVIVPLFPHATGAMTGSILRETERAAAAMNLPWRAVPAWGNHPVVLNLWSQYLARSLHVAGESARVLFVAHGIPQRDVQRGDDYPEQVAATARALGERLPAGTPWTLAYQSKVGPVKWTGPYLEQELARLAKSPQPLIIMPLSFVSDCLETLYDLDIVALETARKSGIETVVRVRVFNDDPDFARALAEVIRDGGFLHE